MAFHFFERTTLSLSIIMLSALSVAKTYAEDFTVSVQPSTPQACAYLESNVDRLNCYDQLFKPDTAATLNFVSERQAARELSPEAERSWTAKVKDTAETLIPTAGAPLSTNTSWLDQRWELSPESKLGTWNLRAYQPIYLLPLFWTSKKNEQPTSANPVNRVSTDEKQNLDSMESKFQISFKTKALENIFGDNGDLWLGYTQSSHWQVYNSDESRPFRETNYEPEASLMFRTNYEILGLNARLLGLSFNHQSNGRSDPWSRSWNRAMLNIGLERDNFILMIRPWYRIPEKAKDDNNPDITDYMGRGDLTALYRWHEHQFSLMLRHSLKGGSQSHGAVQFDWAFPIGKRLRGHFQLFDGYGESLIDYNHRATYVGIGMSLLNWF
ncbi:MULTISPECIES: phospholipase A [unclassified Acinetobacter]|uniref:phospholipase A n=1 Tax=unclassified Acinetobacter TaxID=196816 RepID=UPI0029344833|nr:MULTISPECIES: phospholipase A [unclassified Acinetobacter]WOE32125.1 phospholipase A [Acinetobacter sp. SAAs470]WOE37594.1 phospholipase A [Acinetobacter sp. SAAs474]